MGISAVHGGEHVKDKPYTGAVRSRADGNVRGSFRIARADLAGYLLDAVEDSSVVRATISVAG